MLQPRTRWSRWPSDGAPTGASRSAICSHPSSSRRAAPERKLGSMSLGSSGPRRSGSVESYLRQTRAGAVLALLALAAAIASEHVAEHLWVRHPLLAGLASSAIIVLLSVAVVNEALEI